ncbi:MAG: cation diffusion facilitator family transporter [Peptoniphilaceae bacterium]|uniref:cation diffusion facilitator family transporter n=1 Tax=Parvimonas sp. TaxID=1944660 RepID=UPI0025DE96AE|nr:cation diffusion facilitator family transporter [Parvimonas sp.]MCI5997281.1 cation diffusion facilitator family transporter [Parvimonas sp.]MDD7765445.1 cation diffusion facilitator family transporter [Peptoniphilaceae bacterium]MDY3050986.1 cation diffusion facilitator family transporter [Parvimonas sp.]
MIEKMILNSSKIEGTNKYDRKKVGYFSGIIGVGLNITLGISKFLIGILVNSIAVTADSVNNFSDAVYSSATVLGFKFSSAPPDKDHPYGHGRVEYVTTLIISMMIMLVGFQFSKSSIERIISPVPILASKVSTILLIVSVFVKLWMSIFNRKLSLAINSSILKATSIDCLSDVFTTSVVVCSLLISRYTKFPLDGIVGLVVSGFILYSGFSLAKETVSQLISEAPSDELIKSIMEDIEKHENILGVHNLTFHKYGHLKTIATVDVEVFAHLSLVKAHNIISVIEKEIFEKYEISLVIHIDPVGGNYTDREKELNKLIDDWTKTFSYIKSTHGFAIYKGKDSDFLGIELVLDGNNLPKNFVDEELKKDFDKIVKSYDESLNSVVSILFDYV